MTVTCTPEELAELEKFCAGHERGTLPSNARIRALYVELFSVGDVAKASPQLFSNLTAQEVGRDWRASEVAAARHPHKVFTRKSTYDAAKAKERRLRDRELLKLALEMRAQQKQGTTTEP